MTTRQIKTAHFLAFGVLLLALLFVCFAISQGDLSPAVGLGGWAVGVLLLLLSYSYFQLRGLIRSDEI